MQEMIQRARALLESGACSRVLAWKKGETDFDVEPAFFDSATGLEGMTYNGFCGANLSKYLIEAGKLEGKTLVFLKPCDSYSYNQLLREHRVEREKAYIIGIGCKGKLAANRIPFDGLLSVSGADYPDCQEILTVETLYGTRQIPYRDVMLERCHVCKGKQHVIYDELLGESADTMDGSRLAEVEKIEAMQPQERFAFFQAELSKCIRCNACRNVCPACSCRKCVFDSTAFDSSQKANTTSFEEKMFHIIRAFHVAGRCTDCGECSRVCPQGIPLHLINRKLIKDINTLYGDYQAGASLDSKAPLTSFRTDDAEPGVGRG